MEGKKDALGNEIVKGETYGYSRDSNGMLYITIGKALHATKKGITLEVVEIKSALYDDGLTPATIERNKVNVKSGKLFPIK